MKPKPKTTRTRKVTNTIKKNHRSWLWWVVVIAPVLFTAWLILSPMYTPELEILELKAVERAPMRSMKTISPPPSDDGGIVDDETKEDLDWMLGHLYKLSPLVLSALAIWKKKPLTGK